MREQDESIACDAVIAVSHRASQSWRRPRMNTAAAPTANLDTALAHATRLLATDPALAGEQATEIIKAVGEHPAALLVLGVSRRARGDLEGALRILQPLAATQPNSAVTQLELGITLGRAGQGDAAASALRRAVALKPDLPQAWLALGDHLMAMDDAEGADLAYANHVRYSTRDPQLLAAATALCENRIPEAEALLREHLKRAPTDVAAIRMLAEVAAAPGPQRRRREPAGALPGTGARLPRRAPELRAGAASLQQAGRGAGPDRPAARARTRQSRLSQPQGGGAMPYR